MWMVAGCALFGLALCLALAFLRAGRLVREGNTVGNLPPGRFSPKSERLLLRMARRQPAGAGRLHLITVMDNERVVALFRFGRGDDLLGTTIKNDADVAELSARLREGDLRAGLIPN